MPILCITSKKAEKAKGTNMLPRSLGRSLAVAALGGAAAAVQVRASCKADTDAFSRARVTEKIDVASTRWIKLQTLSYTDATGRSRKWDMASRTTRRSDGGPDAVAILALLRTQASPHVDLLLVQQFRPPVGAVTVELPAGLIDAGETAEMAALREVCSA